MKDLKAEDEVEIKEKKICKGRDIGNISSPATKTKLLEILEREANSKQGHKIAMDVMQSDSYRNQHYERVVEYFNALLKGLAEQKG